jgi:hypothetical protein
MARTAPDRRLIKWVIVGAVVTLIVVAGVDALRSSNDEAAAPSTTPTRKAFQAGPVGPVTRTVSRIVEGVRFSFRVPTAGWERFGSISINKSTVGPQGAEAMIFWTSFPDSNNADLCTDVLSRRAGQSVAPVGDAVARAPGTRLVTGPSELNIDGRAAMQVVLTVRKDAGCDPGFFYTWRDAEVGAFWPATGPGDTIRVWIIKVDGTLLFIEAETNRQADSQLEREIQQIIESIRFA